jgi:hypothetical protein
MGAGRLEPTTHMVGITWAVNRAICSVVHVDRVDIGVSPAAVAALPRCPGTPI